MTKIGFFIMPNNKIYKNIINYKKKIKSTFGNQIYLNHFPHVTIGVLNVKKDFFENFKFNKKKLKKIISEKYLNFFQPLIFENDFFANNGNTLVYEIKNFKWLQNFQLEIFDQLQNYREKNIPEIKYNKRWMEENNINYGYSFVGNYWKPHITISSILVNKNNRLKYLKLVDEFLIKKINFKQKVDNICFYNIKKNSHTLIKKYKL